MSFLGIELNDIAITGVTADGVLFAQPGCALAEDNGVVFGDIAKQAARLKPSAFHDRYWQDLSEQTLTRRSGELESFADLAFAQLQQLWREYGAGTAAAGFAVPASWTREQLALLLGVAEEAKIPLQGLVELPVAATRREYPGYQLLHIELSTHAVTVSRMSQDGAAAVAESYTIPNLGRAALERTCIDYVARRFLECSRFDPLHDATSEQGLQDLLDNWIAELARSREAEVALEFKENTFRAKLSLAELEERLRRRCEPLIQRLRATLDVAHPTALQLSAGCVAFPGIAEALADLPGCDVFVLEQGAAARGLAQRHDHLERRAGAFTVTATLPWDQPPADVDMERAMATSSGLLPTHLVLGGQAYRLAEQPLRIGAEASVGEYSLVIGSPHTGVSRRHCSIELSDGRALLIDHSRYGTRLNGHRIDGSTVLQPGDLVSIGDPPCELRLIAETGPTG